MIEFVVPIDEKIVPKEYIDAMRKRYPERKKGRWIRTTKADYVWECSACGYGFCDYRTTYCYDCGAIMEE